ncbi:SAV_2336 N-terminal domain-related protein [Streptomyces sp. NPDC005648]|uniref:SAV_2336 N-terminal domain-related protein n=1 Tax=Streptomyces sp. NPDC005648 TaxID=3157044 RepID=UPI0033B8CAA1
MPSAAPGSRDPLARLADVLAAATSGTRPSPLELAELLWLARHMEPTASAPQPAAPTSGKPGPAEDTHPAEVTPTPPPPPPRPSPESSRTPLHLPPASPSVGTNGTPHTTLLAPAPPMLRHPLGLQRSLRPLKRRVDAPVGQELDEHATADRIARLGAAPEWWLPVMRPARERWLRLNLVYDTGPTMPVWRPLIRELHTALAQSGVFRTVTRYRAEPDGTVRGPGAPTPADGRTVTLLVSDCMGPQWRQGPAGDQWYITLHRWARRMPLAVVQPLPEHLWRTTALPTTPGRLSAPHPASPTTELAFTPYEPREEAPTAVPLPVMEPDPRWLANWAALIAAPGGTELPSAVALLDRMPDFRDDHEDIGLLSAEELVLRFRATASPEAFRLAGHLAVGRPDLPVMRLVHAALEPDPRPQHLAEVILSGMLTTVPGPPGSYAFRDGVRDLLLLGLPRTARGRTTELLEQVGGLIDRRAGRAPGEFRASAPAPSGTMTGPAEEAFATVRPESVRILSDTPGTAPDTFEGLFAGRYRLVREIGPAGTHWLARDTGRGDTAVVVRMYPRTTERRSGFLDICRRLSRIRHPAIAPIQDYGIEGEVPYLVRAFIDGWLLSRRVKAAPHGLPAAELGTLVPPLVEAVEALEALGAMPAALDASHIVITAGGPVLTSLDALPIDAGSRGDTLRSLGHIVRSMHLGAREHSPFFADPLDTALEEAVADLLSDDPERQERGAGRLRLLPPHRDGPLASVPELPHPTVVFEADDLSGRPEARIALEYAVDQILERAGLAQREVRVREHGYLVRAQPGAYVLPVLVATMRGLPEALGELADPPRLRVTFWHTPDAMTAAPGLAVPPEVRALQERTTADILVVVSPSWYEEFAASSAAYDPPRFTPLHGGAPDAPPVAWYRAVSTAGSETEERDLVKGPFLTHDLGSLGIPAPGRAAIVHTRADGPLTLLNPAQPHGTRPPRRTTYYEVDLTTHQAFHSVSLPSSGKGAFAAAVELSWHVVDPVAFVRGETTRVAERLLDHVLEAAPRITRRHPLRRAGAAQRAVNSGLGRWPVPGLAISYSVQLSTEGTPLPVLRRPAPLPPAALLADAETVLFGFDGPLTRLFSATTAREAALDLLAVVAEHRDREGESVNGPPPGAPGREGFGHPLDVLRAFAHDRLARVLCDRLDELELRAVPDAPLTHNSVALVRALHHTGRRTAVVTDVCEQAARRYLEPYRLPLAGVHGRAAEPGLLTPDPDCLLRALRSPAGPVPTGLLIGATVAELTAAQQLGLPFIGLARNPTIEHGLREAGCEVTVPSLAPLLEAAHSL